VNLSHLLTFRTVVESGSFSKAANLLGLSQPAVSAQVRALEDEVGESLLDRSHRRIELTEAGELLLPAARSILEAVEAAEQLLHERGGQIAGTLVIAASTIPGNHLVSRLMGSFLQAYPQVKLVLSITDTTRAIEAVHAGQAHLAIVGARIDQHAMDYRQIGTDELIVITAPSDPLAERTELGFSDLSDRRWILRPEQSGTRQVTDAVLVAAGLDSQKLDVALTLSSDEAIITAVEAGLGIAMMSRLVANRALELGTVTELALDGNAVLRPLYLAVGRRNVPRAAAAFLAFIEERLSTPAHEKKHERRVPR